MYFEEINVKQIISRYAKLDLGDCCKLEIILAINKDNNNEEKDERTKFK